MKTIKNLTTQGGLISLSFDMSNVNGLLPISTIVGFRPIKNGILLPRVKIKVSENADAAIPLTDLSSQYNLGVLSFETALVYDKTAGLLDKIKAIRLNYIITDNGVTNTITSYDNYSTIPNQNIVLLIQNVSIS